jgi:hypothetical protein
MLMIRTTAGAQGYVLSLISGGVIGNPAADTAGEDSFGIWLSHSTHLPSLFGI